ncbi:MAG: lipoyl(octanoyl) transferase LipB [Bacteroidales bacterium]|jgi:lipoyl(octanoyl) transferase|nr:lipoyl(octanoyl) transferase LipB [Bacteroidales bacterium]
MHKIIYQNWGIIHYKEALEKQNALFNPKVRAKLEGKPTDNYFVLCQHPHVYTLGKNGQRNNLLINSDFLNKIQAEYYETNRGGDITYHGYGQIVGYPVIDLEQFNLGLKDYIHLMEQCIINLMYEYGIKCERLKGATGVWLESNSHNARKICAIGVKVSRSVTMHGFALNVNTDLSYFNYINPCGFTDKSVTSMAKEIGGQVDMNAVEDKLQSLFIEMFQGRCEPKL